MMTYKVLFLDIDGVLNSRRSCVAFGQYPLSFCEGDMGKFDRVAIALIRKLCEETGTSIVLSSDWRGSFTPREAANGLNLPIIDATPILYSGSRGMEINMWLTDNPEVTTYAIVDDNNWMLPDQQARFVQTDETYGLTLENYRQLKVLLRN
jgi:hypothetical protein